MIMAARRQPLGPTPYDKADSSNGDDEVPTPRLITLTVEGYQFAVVTVPLAAGSALSKLTPVERQVACLASDGFSNAEIGRWRGTSERTVANQIASIFRKLNVGSRYHLASRLACSALDRRDP
jgi:DNA-binding CsgD family transcriptional regulator